MSLLRAIPLRCSCLGQTPRPGSAGWHPYRNWALNVRSDSFNASRKRLAPPLLEAVGGSHTGLELELGRER